MRTALKTLVTAINTAFPEELFDEKFDSIVNDFWNEPKNPAKKAQLRKWYMRRRVKLNPVAIPAGTKFAFKGASGYYEPGKFTKNCKAVGLIDYDGPTLLLDKDAVFTDSEIKDGKADICYDHDRIPLSALSTGLLEQLVAAIA